MTEVTFITTRQARVALDSMDDYARMANVDAHGPRSVLEQFIDQIDRAEGAAAHSPVRAIATEVTFRPSNNISHN